MPQDTIHEASEYEEKPGQANSRAARQDEALAEATRGSADPMPPIAGPYNGWRR
jgi:hypothetical protein